VLTASGAGCAAAGDASARRSDSQLARHPLAAMQVQAQPFERELADAELAVQQRPQVCAEAKRLRGGDSSVDSPGPTEAHVGHCKLQRGQHA
jgi:hypothetical protein